MNENINISLVNTQHIYDKINLFNKLITFI